MILHLDLETRSRVDLFKEGVYNYATCPSTEVTIKSWAFDDEDPELWLPPVTSVRDDVCEELTKKGFTVHENLPTRFVNYLGAAKLDVAYSENMIYAHNAAFERLMLWYILCPDYDLIEPPLEQFYCTATQARANNMPAQLDKCARALRVKELKDAAGKQLITRLSIPNDEGEFTETVEDYVNFAIYCAQDVRAERDISHCMRPLTEVELEDYYVNETINDRGLMVDTDLARVAANYADEEQAELLTLINKYTHGQVSKARGKKLTEWVYQRLDEDQQKHMHKYKDGKQKISFDKTARARLMSDTTVGKKIRDVVEASDFAQASSTAKFNSMLKRADPEDLRVRGAYVLYGASGTHRYSSKGLQTHNMPRDSLDKVGHDKADTVKAAMLAHATPQAIIDLSGYGIMQTLKRLLRYSIRAAPGNTFVCGDWGQIEARANPWLAMGISARCDQYAQQALDAFINQTDEYDVYCMAAEGIYGYPVRKSTHPEERQIGKVAVLSLGFGGGIGAFKGMAVNYGVSVSDEEAEHIKQGWRNTNAWAPIFWSALEKGAIKAVRRPMTPVKVGRLTYLFQPDINHGSLWCLLPSGNVLCYPDARVDVVQGKYGPQAQLSAMKANWSPKQGESQWPRIKLWGGVLCENCIAHDTEVLTDQGWIPIQDVKNEHLLWDGIEWVSHDGLAWKGEQECCTVYGINTTPDHEVLTDDGWQQAQHAYRYDRHKVSLPNGYQTPCKLQDTYVDSCHRETKLQKFQVYDLVNAGPRQRFVVRGTDGPVIVHNCTQATCAVLLRELLADLVLDMNAPVVGHTHDEALLEVPIEEAEQWKKRLNKAMVKSTSWAEGLPLDSDIWVGPRYRK